MYWSLNPYFLLREELMHLLRKYKEASWLGTICFIHEPTHAHADMQYICMYMLYYIYAIMYYVFRCTYTIIIVCYILYTI